jgi:rubrerythrin
MNIYEFAMKMEADGKNYYVELRDKSENTAIKKIFDMLAKDEQAHYDAIKLISEYIEDSKILDYAANVFEELEETGETIPFEAGEDSLRHALDIEYKSIKFYEEQAEKAEKPQEKILFNKLVSEEGKHYILIENLLDHVSGGLLRGIESPEFPALDY